MLSTQPSSPFGKASAWRWSPIGTRAPSAALIEAIHCRRVVCLLADRDLSGTGVPVSWRGQSITMPAGPAIVARRTGAALLPAVCQFTEDGMAIIIGEPIAHRQGRDGLAAMMQDVADFFADTIARQPEDWHMMQPLLLRSGASPGGSVTDPRRPLRVGMVCPYSFDVPGGVQNHVLGLARYLRQAGHRPYVLAPGELGPSAAALISKTLPASVRPCPFPTTGLWPA